AVADGVVGTCDRCPARCGAGGNQERLPALPGRLQLDIRPTRARRLRAERGGRLSRYALDVAPADRGTGAGLVMNRELEQAACSWMLRHVDTASAAYGRMTGGPTPSTNVQGRDGVGQPSEATLDTQKLRLRLAIALIHQSAGG